MIAAVEGVKGVARLAGLINFAKKAYDNPAGRFAMNAVPDFGFGVMMGQNPLVAGLGAVTGGLGQVAGEKAFGGIARAMGKGETTQRIAENIGGIPGYLVGSMGGYALAPVLNIDQGAQPTEQMGNPDSMQQDPRQAQMQSDQQMMSQLTPDQIQRLQEQAARKAAQAQYQAAAMQQYGGGQ